MVYKVVCVSGFSMDFFGYVNKRGSNNFLICNDLAHRLKLSAWLVYK